MVPQVLRAKLGDAVGIQLRSDREGRGQPIRESLGARGAQQVRAIDVDYVERHGHAREPLRLGHQLLGQQGQRHHVEGMDPLHLHGPLPPKPAGGLHAVRLLCRIGGGALLEVRDQRLAGAEVTVEG